MCYQKRCLRWRQSFGNPSPVRRRQRKEQTAEEGARGQHLRTVFEVDLLKESTRDRIVRQCVEPQGGRVQGGENGWQYLKVTPDTSPFSQLPDLTSQQALFSPIYSSEPHCLKLSVCVCFLPLDCTFKGKNSVALVTPRANTASDIQRCSIVVYGPKLLSQQMCLSLGFTKD